jgi:UTP--glucose-1-phosphate uridylyltransferase
VYSFDVAGKRYDIGSRIGYIEATLDFGLKRDDVRPQVIDLLKKKLAEIESK